MKTKANQTIAFALAGLLALSSFALVSCDQTPPDDDPVETGDDQMIIDKTNANSVLSWGAVADGETDNTEAFKSAIAESTGGILIPAGNYYIASDVKFTKPVVMEPGAVLIPASKVTLTFAKYLDAGLYRIFGEDGDVILNGNSTSYPEWFGAIANGVTNSTDAIQRAIDCFPTGGGRVEFMPGKYKVTNTITVKQNNMTLAGAVRQTRELSPQITSTQTKKPVLHLKGTTGGNPYDGSLEDVTIENMEFTRDKMGSEGSDTILVENTIYTTLQNVGVSLSQNGVRAVNANGLRMYTIHCTTGGDLPGKEVRGIFIDGSKRGSTGILIDDLIYYAYGSPNSVTYGYKDEALVGNGDGSVGDRRITNFECSGATDYGIYIKSAGDFACDIAISDFTMDGISKTGIHLEANNPYTWQQANITNAYFRIDDGSGKASGITVTNFANVHVSNCHVDNAVGKNDGVVFNNTFNSTVESSSFSGNDYNNLVKVQGSNQVVVSGNTSDKAGSLNFTQCKNTIVTSNAMPSATLRKVSCTNSIFEYNIVK